MDLGLSEQVVGIELPLLVKPPQKRSCYPCAISKVR